MTTTFPGVVHATNGIAAPQIEATAGDLHCFLAEGKALCADRISTSTAGADLRLDASGENIDCCGKRLINVAGISPGASAAAALTPEASTGAACSTTFGSTPFHLMSLETDTDTAYVVSASVSAMGSGAGAAFYHVLNVYNGGGSLTAVSMVASEHIPAALVGLSIEFIVEGTTLRAVARGLEATTVKWAGSLTFNRTV